MPMSPSIENALHQFFSRHRQARLITAVVDTGVKKSAAPQTALEMVPYLNLRALDIAAGKALRTAWPKIAATGHWEHLEDLVEELDCSAFEICLEPFYPNWPDGLAQGDGQVVRLLQASAACLPAGSTALFYHVDSWPPLDLRTGQPLDLS